MWPEPVWWRIFLVVVIREAPHQRFVSGHIHRNRIEKEPEKGALKANGVSYFRCGNTLDQNREGRHRKKFVVIGIEQSWVVSSFSEALSFSQIKSSQGEWLCWQSSL